ncbi:3-keto-5-aminohexanoate cleavage protein [Sporomusa aerivorans]|uniref:3-keto-5-aminohexanoate cleavage protein n=1 Tax=Sporomusa aerivorans TaxID=204936 RepID=UPI00352AAC9D
MDKVIITAALTGAVTPKDINPHIPMTPEEIANDAYECWKVGAAVVHLHMRDEKGLGTMNTELFQETVALVKEKCDVVINLTTSGDNRASDEERMAHIAAIRPEMASFDAGSFNWMPAGVFMNTPQFLEKLGKVMIENQVKPELEIFDSGMIHTTEYYLKKGVLLAPPHYQFVLGVLGAAMATVENLVYLRNLLPKNATWSAFGIGKAHLPILYAAIALGGNVRVGLEDNVYYSKDLLATNVDLVARAGRLVKEAGKEVATPADARQILGLRGSK